MGQSTVYEQIKQDLLRDEEFIRGIRRTMEEKYFVWGESERLHLSGNNSVVNTLFNTMSGDIYVGEYTFTGHNVSIITGTHDVQQVGSVRMEFPESGGDIVIGNGVWICSNTTILGPCTIGDNAVIAAGSVVLPNTNIGEHELYAGVPAVFKKQVASDIKFQYNYVPLYGFHEAELDTDGVFIQQWTKQKEAKCYYRLKDKETSRLKLRLASFIPQQAIRIYVNDTEQYAAKLESGVSIHMIQLPTWKKERPEIGIKLCVDMVNSPKQYGMNEDVRMLGVALQDISEE